MRKLIRGLLLLSLVAAGARAETAADPVEGTPVASKITAVTVYADRAQVTRTAEKVQLGGRLAFAKLPGWLDEGSVRVSINPAGAGEVTDVQIFKTFLARPEDADLRKAADAVQELADQVAALDNEGRVLDAQERQIEAIRAFSLDKWPKDAAAREVKPEEYGGLIRFIGESRREINTARFALEKQRRDLQPELDARNRRLAELRQRAQLEQRTVVVSTSAAAPATATVTLTYMLPGTTWEPLHELRASPDDTAITLASSAVVSQTTGEDWDGATLTFSTQRPNETARIPELEAMLVGGGRPLAHVTGAGTDSFQLALTNWSSNNSTWNTFKNSGDIAAQVDFEDNVKQQGEIQRRVIHLFREVQQQRGTTAQFTAPAPQTVRTDGRSVRVPLATLRLTAAPRTVAAPEVSLNAVRTAELTNRGAQPLLPGKVLLYREGAFIGTTEIEFTAPGETFSVFLGMDDRLKLSRSLDKKRSSLTWSGKRKRMAVAFVITVENLSEKPAAFQLADRVPVSENEEIRVQSVKIQPDAKPDSKGLLKWDVTLAPKEKREFRLDYTLEYPLDLPQRPVGNEKLQIHGADRQFNAPAAPADLSEQIRGLEAKF